MKPSKILAGMFSLVLVASMPLVTIAQSTGFGSKYLDEVGKKSEETGLTRASLPEIIARLVNVVISVLGLVLFIFIVWAGYLWMTAQGDEKQVQRAKDMIKNAIIGLVLVAASFAISSFVLSRLSCVTTGTC